MGTCRQPPLPPASHHHKDNFPQPAGTHKSTHTPPTDMKSSTDLRYMIQHIYWGSRVKKCVKKRENSQPPCSGRHMCCRYAKGLLWTIIIEFGTVGNMPTPPPRPHNGMQGNGRQTGVLEPSSLQPGSRGAVVARSNHRCQTSGADPQTSGSAFGRCSGAFVVSSSFTGVRFRDTGYRSRAL